MKPRASGDLALHRLADSVYVYRGYFSNSAVLVMKKCVVVVDTQVSPLAAKRLRARIESVTSLPIRYVINTHYHGDHTGGNAVFPEAEIISSGDTARFIIERDSERVEYADTFGLSFAEVHPTISPTRTFEQALDLDIDGDRLELRQLGRVETPDACVVHWPARNTIACGDGIATHHYPYLGVPFLDEGLRDDGSWLGYLAGVKALRPNILIPGHGPALSSSEQIDSRLDLLSSLMTDLLDSVRSELRAGTPIPALIEKVDNKLAHYRRRRDLQEHTVSQRFAIYRCINNMIPERKGKGWWHDLRPSVIDPTLLAAPEPQDAAGLAQRSDVFFDQARTIPVKVDATEYIRAAVLTAKKAQALDPNQPLALLTLGSGEVFGGMILAQPMASGIDKLERALASGALTGRQRMRALFFLGRAHQLEQRDAESDRCFRAMLPWWLRFLYPLLREKIRNYP